MLSDSQIRHAMRWRGLGIRGFRNARLQPASVDVTLHPAIKVLKPFGPVLDPKVDTAEEFVQVAIDEESGYTLRMGNFVLASTMERVEISTKIFGQLHGKSSLARLGIQIHSTAGILDPGFKGQITLELSCAHDRGIVLYPGMPIGQITFDNCPAVESPYNGKYVDQDGPTPSRYHENWDGVAWR